jgi:hypothetical protein
MVMATLSMLKPWSHSQGPFVSEKCYGSERERLRITPKGCERLRLTPKGCERLRLTPKGCERLRITIEGVRG